jgi:DNA-binding PadR family transcriptional regulator
MTLPTQAVLGALLAAEGEVFGLEIVRTSRLGAGTIYPILQRLQTRGHARAVTRPPNVAPPA